MPGLEGLAWRLTFPSQGTRQTSSWFLSPDSLLEALAHGTESLLPQAPSLKGVGIFRVWRALTCFSSLGSHLHDSSRKPQINAKSYSQGCSPSTHCPSNTYKTPVPYYIQSFLTVVNSIWVPIPGWRPPQMPYAFPGIDSLYFHCSNLEWGMHYSTEKFGSIQDPCRDNYDSVQTCPPKHHHTSCSSLTKFFQNVYEKLCWLFEFSQSISILLFMERNTFWNPLKGLLPIYLRLTKWLLLMAQPLTAFLIFYW